jgi:hypothetical protein
MRIDRDAAASICEHFQHTSWTWGALSRARFRPQIQRTLDPVALPPPASLPSEGGEFTMKVRVFAPNGGFLGIVPSGRLAEITRRVPVKSGFL